MGRPLAGLLWLLACILLAAESFEIDSPLASRKAAEVTTPSPSLPTPFKIAESPGLLYDTKPLCTPSNMDCRGLHACCEEASACFEKDVGWAECRADCWPGVHAEDGRYTSHPTPWSCRQIDGKARFWQVREGKGLAVYASQSEGSERLGWKSNGTILEGVQEGSWLALKDQPGFVMVWNGDVELLQHVQEAEAVSRSTTVSSTTLPSTVPRDSALTKRLRLPAASSTSKPDSVAASQPLEMHEFKQYLFTAYSSESAAFSALGSGDDMTPLRRQDFIRGASILGLPLSLEKVVLTFKALDTDSSDTLTFTEFSNGLRSEHTKAWTPTDLSKGQTRTARRRPSSERAELSNATGPETVPIEVGAASARTQHADTPRPEDAKNTSRPSPANQTSSGTYVFGTPAIVIINGFLSCLMVPFVCIIGFCLCSVAKEKSSQRKRYKALGDDRALMMETNFSDTRFIPRRRQPHGADSGQYGVELHPGVPDVSVEAEAREFRLSPRERQAAGGPQEGGKKRRLISL